MYIFTASRAVEHCSESSETDVGSRLFRRLLAEDYYATKPTASQYAQHPVQCKLTDDYMAEHSILLAYNKHFTILTKLVSLLAWLHSSMLHF